MEEKAREFIELMEKEYELYCELFFNEFDKGCLLYEHEIELFNKKNEVSSLILNEIGTIIEFKKNLIDLMKKQNLNSPINLEDLFKNFNIDIYDQFKVIREKLKDILNQLAELNTKNRIILETTYSVSRIMIEGLKKENIYNEKGSLCETSFSTVRYSI